MYSSIHHKNAELYAAFSKFTKAKGFRAGHENQILKAVFEFLCFIERNHLELQQQHVWKATDAYLLYITERPNFRKLHGALSASSIRHHIYSLRLFFDFLLEIRFLNGTPAGLARFHIISSAERPILTLDEIKLLYNKCDKGIELAILSLAYGCGLRRSEMVNLNYTDVNFHKGYLVVREGKNNKSRTVPMSTRVGLDLKKYVVSDREARIALNTSKTSEAFLVNRVGNRMSGGTLLRTFKSVIERTEDSALQARNITLHSLRHSIATHLIDKGAEIQFVQELLGHSLIDTSQLYAKRRKQQLNLFRQL